MILSLLNCVLSTRACVAACVLLYHGQAPQRSILLLIRVKIRVCDCEKNDFAPTSDRLNNKSVIPLQSFLN